MLAGLGSGSALAVFCGGEGCGLAATIFLPSAAGLVSPFAAVAPVDLVCPAPAIVAAGAGFDCGACLRHRAPPGGGGGLRPIRQKMRFGSLSRT